MHKDSADVRVEQKARELLAKTIDRSVFPGKAEWLLAGGNDLLFDAGAAVAAIKDALTTPSPAPAVAEGDIPDGEGTKAAEERDALLLAIGFKAGSFSGDPLTRKVILDDAAALRPEMVKARHRAMDAEGDAQFSDWLLGEVIHDSRSGLLLRLWKALKQAGANGGKAITNLAATSDQA